MYARIFLIGVFEFKFKMRYVVSSIGDIRTGDVKSECKYSYKNAPKVKSGYASSLYSCSVPISEVPTF